MSWITLLDLEAKAGEREIEIKPPQHAAKFEIRVKWDADSQRDPGRQVEVRTTKITRTITEAFANIPQSFVRSGGSLDWPVMEFDEAGHPIPETVVYPGTGDQPVVLENWNQLKNSLRFTLAQRHENGGSPMNCGLQIRWFNLANQELDAFGNLPE